MGVNPATLYLLSQKNCEMEQDQSVFQLSEDILSSIFLDPLNSQKAVRTIVKWHKANKPSMAIIKHKYALFLDRGDNRDRAFADAHGVLESLLSNKASLGVIRAYLTLLKENKDHDRIVLEKMRPYWKRVSIDHLDIFLAAVPIKETITKEELEEYVKELIKAERYDDCKNLIKLFGSSDSLMHELLMSMGTNKTASKAADFIKEMNINQNDFPEINRRLSKKCLRHFLKTEGWQYVDELYEDNSDMIAFAVEDLIYNKQIDLAMTLYNRHLSDKPHTIQKLETKEKIKELVESKNYQTVENFLLKKSQFGPSDENKFLSLKSWGLTEEDIVWIDKDTDGVEEKLRPFLKAKMVGIDTESLVGLTKLEQPKDGVALIQLATDNYLALIDCLNMPLEILAPFFKQLLSNNKIWKVGHTLADDLKNVCQVLKIEKTAQSLIDVQKIFKGVVCQKQSNLSHVSKRILGKEVCKVQTLTNWGRRPLRPSQAHYAIMDAFVVLKIYEGMCQKYGEQYILHFVDEEEMKEDFEYE